MPLEQFRPANYDVLRAAITELKSEVTPDGVVRTPEVSRRLLNEFYLDWGDAAANAYWQSMLIEHIYRIPVESEQARSTHLHGLVEFVQAGGGRLCPRAMTDFGTAIVNVAKPEDSAALQVANDVYTEAHAWAVSVGQDLSTHYVKGERRQAERLFVERNGVPLPTVLATEPLAEARASATGLPVLCDSLRQKTRELARPAKLSKTDFDAIGVLLRKPPIAFESKEPCFARALADLLKAYVRLASNRDETGAESRITEIASSRSYAGVSSGTFPTKLPPDIATAIAAAVRGRSLAPASG